MKREVTTCDRCGTESTGKWSEGSGWYTLVATPQCGTTLKIDLCGPCSYDVLVFANPHVFVTPALVVAPEGDAA